MKLNEFKKRKQVNEIDSRSLFGDYGSASMRTGLGSLAGKNVLSTTDQMAKDDYITKFTSRALSGLESAINGGLVDPNAAGQGAQTTGQTTPQPTQTTPQTTQTTQQDELPSATDAIAQKRIAAQKTQADAIREPGASEGPKYKIDPNKQMSPYSKLPATTPKTPEQIRQEKLAAATQAAQGQMTTKAPAVPVDTPKTPEQIRQEKLAAATQAAQGQMNPMNKLPADQFAKSAANVRQQQQDVATQNAQGEMLPVSKLPTDQFNKSAANVRQRKQSTATKSAKKSKNNTITMPKRNVKPRNAGKNAFGQMAQNLVGDQVAEGSRFAKLNYIFESILAEQDTAQGGTKQTISQYITNFFKQFMKNVDISDPTVMTNVASLAKELEQNYAKDKGKSTLPKLANLAYSVSYAQQLKDPEAAQTTKPPLPTPSTTTTAPQNTTPQAAQASTQQAKMTAAQITKLMKGLSTRQKQAVLKSLQKELTKNSELSIGGKKLDPNNPEDAKIIDMLEKQGKI